MFTIRRYHNIDGLKIAFVGDLLYGRTANSLIRVLSLFKDVTVYCFTPKGFELKSEMFDFMEQKGIKHKVVGSFSQIPSDVNVIYQTRVQKERCSRDCDASFVMTPREMGRLCEKTILMHPLPRVDEIDTAVDNDPRAKYFEQSNNGVAVRMAILVSMLG